MIASDSKDSESLSTHNLIFFILCFMAFLIGTGMTFNSAQNDIFVTVAQLTFLALYFVLLRGPIKFLKTFRLSSPITLIMIAWLICVTISFVISPYDLVAKNSAIYRYVATLVLIAFFFVIRDFFGRYQFPLHWLLITISVSCLAVAFGFVVLWFNLDPLDTDVEARWFSSPPFNAHIRHVGYQATAACSLLAAFFISGNRFVPSRIALLFLFVGLCTFLFWMGGRASVFGVYGAFICLVAALWVKNLQSRQLLIAIVLSTCAGLIISQSLAVFSWNGIFDVVARTAAPTDIIQFTTGRSRLWLTSWESVKDHLLFGLGPQGYWYMPNRILAAQPHSMPVQFLVEWGIIGSVLIYILLSYAFFRGAVIHIIESKGQMNIVALSAGTMITAMTILGFADGPYFHGQPTFYLAIGFAIWTVPASSRVT